MTIARRPRRPRVSTPSASSAPSSERRCRPNSPKAVGPERLAGAPAGARLSLKDYRDRAEAHYITETLRSLDWNISRAAIALGVERTNLHKKIRAYGIRRGS